MLDPESLIAELDSQIVAAEALHSQLCTSSNLESKPADSAASSNLPATIEIKMKAGKSWGWLAGAINKQMDAHPDWTKLKGSTLKSRMGSTMLYRNKTYTFGTVELLGSGPLSGGMSTAEIQKAQKAADWWQREGKERWKAKRAQEEAEQAMAEQMKAEAEDDALREKWEEDNAVGQSMEDPDTLTPIDEEGRQRMATEKAEAEAAIREQAVQEKLEKAKKDLVARLWSMHDRTNEIRTQANSSAVYYREVNHPDSETQQRMIKAMEKTSTGATDLREKIMTSLHGLYDDNKGIRSELTANDIQDVVNEHNRTLIALEIDLVGDKERQKPNTSIGGGLKYSATASGVAGSAAVNGALSEVPVVGEVYERAYGADLKKDLRSAARGALDDEMADHALDSGDVIGRGAMTVVTMANPANAAVIADNVLYGTVEATTGEDVATGRELSKGERALSALSAITSSTSALSKVDSTTKFNTAVAAMDGSKVTPTVISQVANAAGTSKKIADVADNATAAATGRRLFKPEQQLTGSERVLAGVSATAGAGGMAADSTQTGKLHTAMKTQSGAQQIASTAKRTAKHVKTADKVVTAGTGYSVLKEKEVSDKDRLKAGVGAGTVIGKDSYDALDKAGDAVAEDVRDAVSEVELDP